MLDKMTYQYSKYFHECFHFLGESITSCEPFLICRVSGGIGEDCIFRRQVWEGHDEIVKSESFVNGCKSHWEVVDISIR